MFGLDFEDDGRAAAPVDIDGDGDLDLVLMSLQGLRVVENTAPPQHFARVRLVAATSPACALGAQVRVQAGGVTQQDFVRLTDGFQTQVPLDLHFGLGDAEQIDRLTVAWPSGQEQSFADLPADHRLVLREGEEQPEVAELARWPAATSLPDSDSLAFGIEVEQLSGGRVPLAAAGVPLVLNFWAPWCAPCRVELPALERLSGELAEEVQVVGVSVEVEDLTAVKKTVRDLGLTFPQVLANDAVVAKLFGAAGKVPLPATFVFDAEGGLRRAFMRAVTESDLKDVLLSLREEPVVASDLALRGVIAVERKEYDEAVGLLRRAIAADGGVARYHNNLGAALGSLGRHAEAAEAFRASTRLDDSAADTWSNFGMALDRSGQSKEAVAPLERSLQLRPRHYSSLMALARAAVGADELGLALETLDRALGVRPGMSKPHVLKGRLLAHQGRRVEAARSFEAALELDPGSRAAQEGLAKLHRQRSGR